MRFIFLCCSYILFSPFCLVIFLTKKMQKNCTKNSNEIAKFSNLYPFHFLLRFTLYFSPRCVIFWCSCRNESIQLASREKQNRMKNKNTHPNHVSPLTFRPFVEHIIPFTTFLTRLFLKRHSLPPSRIISYKPHPPTHTNSLLLFFTYYEAIANELENYTSACKPQNPNSFSITGN